MPKSSYRPSVGGMSIAAHSTTRRYGLVTPFQRRVANPVARRLGRRGQVVVETMGRKSGLPRQTPVGGRVVGSSFWMVSEFGTQSQYVRNLLVEPRVRVRIDGEWRDGTAHVLVDDDPVARLRKLRPVNSLLVRSIGNDLLTIRIDLD